MYFMSLFTSDNLYYTMYFVVCQYFFLKFNLVISSIHFFSFKVSFWHKKISNFSLYIICLFVFLITNYSYVFYFFFKVLFNINTFVEVCQYFFWNFFNIFLLCFISQLKQQLECLYINVLEIFNFYIKPKKFMEYNNFINCKY